MRDEKAQPMVAVYPDRESLSLAAAALFAQEARRAVAARGRFDVLLSGGETPRRCYELLAEEPLAGSLPWRQVQFFWGDERWVPHDDPLSNFGMACRALLDKLPLDGAQIHPVPYRPTPAESAQEYEKLLRAHFGDETPRFDLVLLGLGNDGHTASLFPGSEPLLETRRWACATTGPAGGPPRVTVTAPLINKAALVAFVVAGGEKACVLQRVLEGERDPQLLPAQAIAPSDGRVLWLADRQSARLLSQSYGCELAADPLQGRERRS